MKLIGWGSTDTGRKRSHNEDSFLVDNESGLFAVADGMGGHRGGATASRMAMDIIAESARAAVGDIVEAASSLQERPSLWALANTGIFVQDELDTAPVVPSERPPASQSRSATGRQVDLALEPTMEFAAPPAAKVMQAAAEKASADIYNAALTDPNLHGMGTTLTAMLYYAGSMYLVHAGDSRAYLFRNNRLEQLTEDHTWIAEQLKAGVMTEDEAKTSKYRHVITRSVGFEPVVEVDSFGVEVESGDCFVLCSDGMSNHLSDDDIADVLRRAWFREVPDKLIDLANERGGDDNITVVTVYAGNRVD